MNMNKVIVTMLCIIVIIGAMFTAFVLFKTDDDDSPKKVETKVAEENILDECTEEYEQIEKKDMLEANSEEEKVSPNCSLTTKTYYKGCEHITSKYRNIPEELVNKTEEQVKEKYPDYEIDKFSSNAIELYKELEGECGEHYIVRDKEGQVIVYQIEKDGTEKEYEKTDITTEYLTETDKLTMEKGIRVNGKQKLNQLIEDFE